MNRKGQLDLFIKHIYFQLNKIVHETFVCSIDFRLSTNQLSTLPVEYFSNYNNKTTTTTIIYELQRFYDVHLVQCKPSPDVDVIIFYCFAMIL